jgi:protease I
METTNTMWFQVNDRKILWITMLVFTFVSSLSAFGEESSDTAMERGVLMVIAKENFRDEELFVPKKMFEKNGIKVTVASTVTSTVTGMLKGKIKPDVLLNDVEVEDYDAVVFVGGIGAQMYYDDETAHKIARDAAEQEKVLSAICIAPNILAKAGVLKDKNATCWDSAILKEMGAKHQRENVVTDGKIITANGPNAAGEFAEVIIKTLSEESFNKAVSPDKK